MIIVLVLAFCNFAIEVAKPAYFLSPIMGLLYMQITTAYVFLDSIVWKDRYFLIFLGAIFVFLHVRNLYTTTLGDADYGIILFKYKIGDNEYTIMKRATVRSIFSQIMLLNISSLYTILTDKTMDMMLFVTENIYKRTGTSSPHITDETFAFNLREETNDRISKMPSVMNDNSATDEG